MKWIVAMVLAGFLLAGCRPAEPAADGFAIYLLAEQGPASLLAETPLDELALAEEPLVAPGDLLSYDTATHTLGISDAALARVQALFALPVPTGGVPFVVTAGGERIYAGAFWTPLSSLSYDGVVIIDPTMLSSLMPGHLRISLGYPAPESFTGADPRSDPRILAAVEGGSR